jgi:hypothetical protein
VLAGTINTLVLALTYAYMWCTAMLESLLIAMLLVAAVSVLL